MSIEAMKQALEALERADKINGYANNKKAINALRQAIEQAEKQEPVVGTKTWFEYGKVVTQHLHPSDIYTRPVVHEVRCTYPQCQATNECVGACSKTAPQKREWVGLTIDEIDKFMPYCHSEFDLADFRDFARDIEGKLKEKNG